MFKQFNYMLKYFKLKRLVIKFINKKKEIEELSDAIDDYCREYGINESEIKNLMNPFLYWAVNRLEELTTEVEMITTELETLIF